METVKKEKITVEASVNAPLEKVWDYWTGPEHITNWYNASDDWHAPHAENDPRTGGKFLTRMAAKDGSVSFDFIGVYDKVINHERISYTLEDGRKVEILFSGNGKESKVTETFEAESENTLELQKSGWQAILDNFKKYTEAN